jgi:hypothetical protein
MATRTTDELLTCHLGLRVTFEADPAFVAEVRRAVRWIARELRVEEVVDTLELIASELSTNGIKALLSLLEADPEADFWGDSPVLSMTLIRFPGGVMVSCWDPFWQAAPKPDTAGPDDESGRGLFLVDALSDRWGCEMDEEEDGTMRGKSIYAVILFSDREPVIPAPTVSPECSANAAAPPRDDGIMLGVLPSTMRDLRVEPLDAEVGRRVLAGLGAL